MSITRLVKHIGDDCIEREKEQEVCAIEHNSAITKKEDDNICKLEETPEKQDSTYFIRFKSNGISYSLPKKIAISLVGSSIYEQCQNNNETDDDNVFIDYPYDDSCAPLLIDLLINSKMNMDQLNTEDQVELLRMFEFLNLPIPEDLNIIREQRDKNIKKYKGGEEVILYINGKKDSVICNYLKKNDYWKNIIDEYGYVYNNGIIDNDANENNLFVKLNYKYLKYIYQFMISNSVYVSEEDRKVEKELIIDEMYSLFGDKGKEIAKEAMVPVQYFLSTKIIVNNMMETPLVNWLGKEKKWKLLFRASEHEYKASEFHKYCDRKGETVTFIKHIGHNNHINIFGGYTDQNWESPYYNSCVNKSYSKEFLFTLTNEHNIPPTKYEYSRNYNYYSKYGIYCSPSCGPSFGDSGSDIKISDNCHSNDKSCCEARYYEEFDTSQKSALFVNTHETNYSNYANYFKVEDYEVYGRA
ncbi:hypothetical protein WA158_007067 [Blastocystis sp. Blastoise]